MGLHLPLKVLGSYLISASGGTRTRLGAHHLGKVMLESSQPRPCWAVEALSLRRCEF